MNRREAVRSVAFLMGGALSATTIGVFLESCNSPSTKTNGTLFTDDQQKLITEVADIIIPTTSSPGAKAAGVGPFISMMVKDCYPDDAQKAFVKGLEDLDKQSKETYKKSFLELSVAQRQELLGKVRDETVAATKAEKENLDKQQQAEKDKQKTNPADAAKSQTENAGNISILPKDKPKMEPRFFAIIRDLTLLGYFTSEIGATQAYAFVEIPGRYDGCVDLKPGQRVWS
ncbi:gluconate 2-dehydrogenase subunit 3 family protein [Pedobacter heparinus]|uniref:Twin-arginine translocation pathway signal n=1 Tax=Pedobacter heparinus (strain ATCC 13125 / DSM 2366 / CIP 104194 / JCM 7457 / NBRC 12017 / NCIMB 9290 / NRRL B-14731 / HIM 762-3) TaxID=485917 RepID=C6XU42_PEDHD|nr:gluconate 2-dehydrogenase subunit 3 family protein [Pedobacter heparinus]ACU05835.1 twin-arginine translocation pathway signal [Pedobacter heparinus DSM 2366]